MPILPHLEYCSPLLVGVGRVLVSRLEGAIYYTLRCHKSILYEDLLRIINMEKLEHCIVLYCIVLYCIVS